MFNTYRRWLNQGNIAITTFTSSLLFYEHWTHSVFGKNEAKLKMISTWPHSGLMLPLQGSSFQAVTSKIYQLCHNILQPKNNGLEMLTIQLVNEKKSRTFVLPNSDPCIHKKVRTKLPAWTGLRWGKFLFHIDYLLIYLFIYSPPHTFIEGYHE